MRLEPVLVGVLFVVNIDALEEHLIQESLDLIGRAHVGVEAILADFQRILDEVFRRRRCGHLGVEVSLDTGEFTTKLSLLCAEHLDADRVVEVRLQ
ncbi:MAG: hypothetical protein D3X82_17345 [Candidatus Leucobacter sulfamidivorax]|nr:hypothetical protein [Candidatus Leucobacter sulfamidivorax]